MFQPGVLQGAAPTLTMLTADTNAYNTDKNNLAPSVGVAWTVGSDKGFLHKLLGSQGDSVVRGGFSVAYQRPGMSDFTSVFGGNPGVSIDATRNQTNGNLGTVPVLLRSSDLGPPPINLTRTYPMSIPSAGTSIYAFDPEHPGHAHPVGVIGMQRALGKTMMVEARWIHTNSYGEWTGVTNGVPQLQRDQRQHQRLREGIPGRAGQPAGEHRGRQGQYLRLHRRGRHQPAADLPGVSERLRARRRRRHDEVLGHGVDQHDAASPTSTR